MMTATLPTLRIDFEPTDGGESIGTIVEAWRRQEFVG